MDQSSEVTPMPLFTQNTHIMRLIIAKKGRIRRPSGSFIGNHISQIMKQVAVNLRGLLFRKPAAAIGQENETLDKVLRQWVPEVWHYPEQLARIRRFVYQQLPDFPAGEAPPLTAADLQRYLSDYPPHLNSDKLDPLLVMLEGVIAVMDHFQLQSGSEFSSVVRAHKADFLSNLKKQGACREWENPDPGCPGMGREI